MNFLYLLSLTLVIVGALNWGLVGSINFNLVETLQNKNLIRGVYILVGLSAIYLIISNTILSSNNINTKFGNNYVTMPEDIEPVPAGTVIDGVPIL